MSNISISPIDTARRIETTKPATVPPHDSPTSNILNKIEATNNQNSHIGTFATTSEPKTGADLAGLYLPDETADRRSQYAAIYDQTRSIDPEPPTDIEALRAYFTFEGDVIKAVAHLRCFMSLKELGFPDDEISTALIMHNNNQEQALEYLIRGQS